MARLLDAALLVVATGVVSGYQPSVHTSSASHSRSYFSGKDQPFNEPDRSNDKTRKVKYDLGLGKNPPFKSHKSKTSAVQKEQGQQDSVNVDETNVYEACRFLVEHEGSQQYPFPENSSFERDTSSSSSSPSTTTGEATFATAPDEQKQATKPIPSNAGKQNKRGWKKVRPKRTLEDVLVIISDESSTEYSNGTSVSAELPTMVMPSAPEEPLLDVNSIWVEMLLHNQLNKN